MGNIFSLNSREPHCLGISGEIVENSWNMNLYSSILTLYTFDWILCRLVFAIWQGAYSLWRGRSDQELFWHFLIINITLRHHFKNTGAWVFAQFFLYLSFFCSTAQRLSWQTTLPADNHLCLTSITFLRHRASHSFNEVGTRLICKPNRVAWRKFKAANKRFSWDLQLLFRPTALFHLLW